MLTVNRSEADGGLSLLGFGNSSWKKGVLNEGMIEEE